MLVLLGALVVFLMYVCLMCGGLTVIHDQLDGEILTYILKAKNPFSSNIPQLFNGTPSSSMTPPAILFTLTYMVFAPERAFHINNLIIALTAYFSMFFCVEALLGKKWIAVVSGFLFSLLPFYPVYGLSVMGQPMIVYAFYKLWISGDKDNKNNSINSMLPYALICLFGITSSLVLVGYSDLIILAVITLYGLFKHKNIKPFLKGCVLLLCVYCATNLNLIIGVIGINGFVTHKTEYVASASGLSFWHDALNIFKDGYYHAASYHTFIIPISFIAMLFALLFRNKLCSEDTIKFLQMGSLLILSILIAVFYAFWHCRTVVGFRNQIGGMFVAFQIDRFYWLYPVIWFLLLAYSLYFVSILFSESVRWVAIIATVTVNAFFLWNNSSLNTNLLAKTTNIVPNNYSTIDTFFQEDMFDHVEDYIYTQTGLKTSDYKVASVGLYPSIALFNGFYCVDGYSNNYDVAYKHEFREVIAEELEKNQDLLKYYDNWGNCVYLFSDEIPFEYYIKKTSDEYIKDFRIDIHKLHELGCDFIFSAVQIDGCDELSLMKTFETNSSSYKLFLYQIVI